MRLALANFGRLNGGDAELADIRACLSRPFGCRNGTSSLPSEAESHHIAPSFAGTTCALWRWAEIATKRPVKRVYAALSGRQRIDGCQVFRTDRTVLGFDIVMHLACILCPGNDRGYSPL